MGFPLKQWSRRPASYQSRMWSNIFLLEGWCLNWGNVVGKRNILHWVSYCENGGKFCGLVLFIFLWFPQRARAGWKFSIQALSDGKLGFQLNEIFRKEASAFCGNFEFCWETENNIFFQFSDEQLKFFTVGRRKHFPRSCRKNLKRAIYAG